MTAQPIHLSNSTPFDLIAESINDLLTEAYNWADGAGVENQAQADEVSRLIEDLRLNAKAADDERKRENEPFDQGKAAIQAKYAPLIADPKTKSPGRVWKAIDALKATLAPYLRKVEEEKREVERVAREAAEAKAREAAEAMRAASAADLESREAAEAKIAEAEAAQKEAKLAANDKAHAVGGSRAMGLRTKRTARLTNARAAAAFFWNRDANAFDALLQKLADDMVRAGQWEQLEGNGFDVIEERVL
jgi:hypothetical protein